MNKKIKVKYSKLLFIITLLLSVIFLLTAFSHTFIRQNIYLLSESKTKTQGEFNQKYQTIYERFKKASNICDYVNSILPNLWDFEQSADSTISYIDEYDDIKSKLTKTASYNSLINEVIVISENFAVAGKNNRGVIYQFGPAVMELLNAEYEGAIGKPKDEGYERVFYPSSKSSIGFIRGEYGLQKPIFENEEFLGWIVVVLDESVFDDFSDEKILILNGEGDKIFGDESVFKNYENIIDSSKSNEINIDVEIYETRNQFVMKKQIPNTQISIAMVSDTGQTDEFSNYIPIVSAALMSLLLAVLLSKMASKQITNPLRKLQKNVKGYELNKQGEEDSEADLNVTEKKMSLRESILMYTIIVLFLPSALFIISSYALSLKNFNNKIQESYMTSVEGVVNNINMYMEDKEKILRIIIYDDLVQQRLGGKEQGDDFEYNINRAMKMGGNKNSIQLYDVNTSIIYSNDDSDAGYLLNTEELTELLSKRKIYKWNNTEKNLYAEYEYSILVKINSLDNFANIGFLKSWIAEKELESIYENLSEAGIIINIVNENNIIVSSENKELIGTKYIKNSDSHLEEHIYDLNYGNWTLVAKYSNSISVITKNSLILERLYILFLILLFTIAVAFVISLYLTKWIANINRLIKKIRLDVKNIDFPEESIVYEFSELSKSFNEMINANNNLAKKIVETTKLAVQLEEQEKKAELKALQFQINSHFIYNAFDGIVWLVKSGKTTAAILMITYLSNFLRYVARTDSPIVKVGEEIEHVKNYISLIKMRFGNKIQFYWDVDNEVLEHKVIRLSVQPIIENAIFHGIYTNDDIGIVEISCFKEGDYLYISVTDDGCGIDETNLEDLIKNINEQYAKDSIGLHNIQSRIKLYFGSEYGIEITSKENAGTRVTLKFPLSTEKEKNILLADSQNI